jgi:ribose transport system permease protein
LNLLIIKRQSWNIGIVLIALGLGAWQINRLPTFGPYEARTILLGILPIALLSMGQAIIIIGGGINLAIGAEAVLINCLAARFMVGKSFGFGVALTIGLLITGMFVGALTGFIISRSKIADIIVTLATSFILIGFAMFIQPSPGGGMNLNLAHMISGKGSAYLPPLIALILPLIIIWIPLYRSRTGIAMYAIGSNKDSAFLSGVNVDLTRIKLYAIGGLFAGISGIVLTAITLSGSPFASISNTATLNSVAGAVLGGVALSGGVGGLTGPALAALILYFIPTILLNYGIDPAYSQIITGALTILVVLAGGLIRNHGKKK